MLSYLHKVVICIHLYMLMIFSSTYVAAKISCWSSRTAFSEMQIQQVGRCQHSRMLPTKGFISSGPFTKNPEHQYLQISPITLFRISGKIIPASPWKNQ